MIRIKLTLGYDGTGYHGWQSQSNAITVQGVLQEALSSLFHEKITVFGCSRTDAGVHAQSFVCHFDAPFSFPLERLPFALNALLPMDISVFYAEEADQSFHARFSCQGKRYCYRLCNTRIRNPFEEHRSAFWPVPLNAEKMNEYSQAFVGTHDFAAFMASGSEMENTVRTIYSFSVIRTDHIIRFTVKGNGFLYNMVRIMVGTLIYADMGKLEHTIPQILASKDRTLGGITVPPQGLYLEEVYY
jgi:tRNA pseudouridine38-40 synthase